MPDYGGVLKSSVFWREVMAKVYIIHGIIEWRLSEVEMIQCHHLGVSSLDNVRK
jgi:hypothetical protein